MDRIQLRRDSSARWAEINPILLEGEVGYEIDTKLRKIGDGVHRWNDLEYLRAEGITQETGDSENATMSQKAITKELSQLGSEVKSFSFFELVQLKNISFSSILTRKGYFLSSGSFEFSEDYRCTPVPLKVKSNTTISVDKVCHVVVFDINGEFVERVQTTINSPYIATSDCMIHLYAKTEYVEQGNFMGYDVKGDLSKTKTAVVELENNVGTIKKDISDINGGETSLEVQYTEGGYIDTTTGEVLAADNWKYSDFIDISTRKDNTLYLLTDGTKSGYNVLCDKNKNIIRALNDDKGWLSEEYITKEAHYVRLSCRISAQQELKINIKPKFLTKEDITLIRVATYNVGDWYNGSTKYIPDDEVIGRGHIFRRLAQKYDLTLLCMNETQEQLDRSGNITDALKYLFEFKYPYRYRHYRHQFGFVSKVPYDSIKGYNFNNDSSRGFLTFDIQLKGKTIKIFIAHCDTGTDFEVKRREQFVQLIAELKTAPYFMCFGDFNCFTTSEFELFANEGFNLANHGFWGDYDTWTNFGKESEAWPNKAIDNIITSSNISIEQVVVDETDISDHRMLVSEIKIS